MAVIPKTIQMFLMDGTASGRKKATLGNWTGITYLLPRTDISDSDDRDDLKQTGVYLLVGKDDDGVDKVYIGQARERKNGSGVLGRIKEHLGEEKLDYWTHAVALVTSNNSFGPTEISYLENRFTAMAQDAARYVVTNSNDPSPGKVTEEKQAELDEFIEYARLVIGSLGYRVFDKLDEAKSPNAPAEMSEPILKMEYGGTTAQGRQTTDGFVVLKGARLRPESEFTPTAPSSLRKNRERYADKIDDNLVLQEDVLFTSPSGAATFVGGAALNGWTVWHTSTGETLHDLEDSKSEG